MKNKQNGFNTSFTGKKTYNLNNLSDVEFTKNEQKPTDTERYVRAFYGVLSNPPSIMPFISNSIGLSRR